MKTPGPSDFPSHTTLGRVALCRSCAGGANAHHFYPAPPDETLQHLAGVGRRVPFLAARPNALRGCSVIRFVRNVQLNVLFHWLTVPELVQSRRGRGSLSRRTRVES